MNDRVERDPPRIRAGNVAALLGGCDEPEHYCVRGAEMRCHVRWVRYCHVIPPPAAMSCVVIWSDDDQFAGLYAEFPSLSHLAHSQEATLRDIVQLVADVGSCSTYRGHLRARQRVLIEVAGRA